MDLEQVSIFKKGMRAEDHITRENVDSMELGRSFAVRLDKNQ
jgi:hypothetical protein